MLKQNLPQYIGILGGLLIAIGWIPETIEIIKTKTNNLNLKFNILYAAGSLALVIYAISIQDWIFTILNGIALLMSTIGLFYKIEKFKK